MRVRMLTTAAGPDVVPAQAGDVVDLDDAAARDLIAAGAAEEVREVAAETTAMTSAFHGGLTAVVPHKVENASIPPNPTMSTARERAEAALDQPIDRRTADEMAADARLAKGGPRAAGAPDPRTGAERVADEIASKVATAEASVPDEEAAARDRTAAGRAKGPATTPTQPPPKPAPAPAPAPPRPAPAPEPKKP